MLVKRKCQFCKNDFDFNFDKSRIGRGKFCNRICKGKFSTGKLASHWKGGLPKCLDCGKQLTNMNNKYCKSHAKIGERSERWKGGIKNKCIDCNLEIANYKANRCRKCDSRNKSAENSHLWKGGITSFEHKERTRFRREIQKQILKRDDYTCQFCGIRGQDMQVDHIQSWKNYVELRFSMDNCRTLCAKCHYKITFGKEMPSSVKTWGHNLKRRALK